MQKETTNTLIIRHTNNKCIINNNNLTNIYRTTEINLIKTVQDKQTVVY